MAKIRIQFLSRFYYFVTIILTIYNCPRTEKKKYKLRLARFLALYSETKICFKVKSWKNTLVVVGELCCVYTKVETRRNVRRLYTKTSSSIARIPRLVPAGKVTRFLKFAARRSLRN